MSELVEHYRRAVEGFGRRVAAVHSDQWHRSTPCTEWDVRDLVNHVTVEQLWAPHLLAGATLEEVGDRFDGDQLGEDPASTWDVAADEAIEAFSRPGALDGTVHLSYGETPTPAYCRQMMADALVHTWDLARAISGDEALDPELVAAVLADTEPKAGSLAASGLFDPPVPVPPDADHQTRLLALYGRDPLTG